MLNFTRVIPFLLFLLCASGIAQINGTRTIGGIFPDYTTITDAITALQTNGINGDVTFNIRDGVYNEKLVISGIDGSDTYNIVFQSQSLDSSKVRIAYTASSFYENHISISDVSNITFRHFSIDFTGNYTCSMLVMRDGAINIKFQNIHFNNLNTSAHMVTIPQPQFRETACQSLEFSNSTFDRGYSAIEISGGYFGTVSNLTILNNKFNNQKNSAIDLTSCENITIKSNQINSVTSTYNDANAFAIGLESGKDFDISNNTIFSSYMYGILIEDCSNTSDLKRLISNNFVITKIDPTGITGYGLNIKESSYVDVIYNSIRVIGGNTGFSSFGLNVSTSTNLNVVNNIIHNNEYGAVNLDSNAGILQWNYNYLLGTGVFARYSTTESTTFEDWKTASAVDANSVTGSITFTSQSDLHIVNGSAISNKGTLWAAITQDIDAEARSASTPDIGADEFALANQAPVINNQTFSINENSAAGTTVGTIVASDPDLNQLTYAITAGNTSNAFLINSTTGVVTVNTGATLNYEVTSSYSLTVSVQDNAATPLSSTATITININNVNEAPVINSQTFAINENAGAGAYVGTVIASDPDAGQNLSFAITAGNTSNAFIINSTNGVITVNTGATLNYETTPSYSLTVRVQDNGASPLSTSATITININNVNKVPVINNQTFAINENASAGANVGTVIASDPDAGQYLSFAITAGNTSNAFLINSTTGVITVNTGTTLNYETKPSYSLTVRVQDNGASPLSSSATITININNVNEAPVINNQTFAINENAIAGTTVGTVAANDPDAGQNLSFAITAGNTTNAFAINGTTGVITINTGAILNYDFNPSYALTIQVTDNGSPSLSRTAVITINLNDVSTGIDDFSINKGLIFPNPSNGVVNLNKELLGSGSIQLEVYNINGELIMRDLQFTKETMDLTGKNGLFTIKIKVNGKVYTEKFIIQN